MTEEKILFLIAAVVVPVALFVLSVVLRRALHRPLTAGADWLLLILAFDITALLSLKDLEPLIQDDFVRNIALGVFVVLMLISLLTWVLSVGIFEAKLEKACGTKNSMEIISWLGISWSVAASVTVINILVFSWKST